MNVLHVIPSTDRATGGPAHDLIQYANALHSAGVRVHVATREGSEAERRWFHSGAPHASLLTFRASGDGAFAHSPDLLRWLGAEARSFDAVHVWGLFNLISSLAARTAIRRNGRVVVTPLGMLSRYSFGSGKARLKRIYFTLLDAPNLRGSSAVHFESEGERDEAAAIRSFRARRSYTIPPPFHAVPPALPRLLQERASRILFMARLHPKKNLELLLDAWPGVVRERPDAELVVAGDGSPVYVARLKAHAAAVPGGERIRFTGFLTGARKEEVLASADVFVLPSHHENLGVAVLEAAASGLPVVLSPEVQIAPFIRDSRLGLVSEREPGELAAALLAALEDPALRERCAREGARAVARHFAPEEIGPRLRRMYADLRAEG